MNRMRALIIILGIFLLIPVPVGAQDEEFDVESHGFMLSNVSGRFSSVGPGGATGDLVLWDERLRTDLTVWPGEFDGLARVAIDAFYDGVDEDFGVELREAYIDLYADSFDLRIGRQVATWGVGDLLFINDFFPKDWESLLGGRPMEYLKIGVDAVRLRHSSTQYNWELFLIPSFEPDNLPGSDRFFSFVPFSEVPVRFEDKPEVGFDNIEAGFRVFGRMEDFDVAAYAYRGFWRTPGMMPDDFTEPSQVTIFYPALFIYGLSAQGNAWDGVLSVEAGYYDSRDDAGGDDPLIPNSQIRFLIGYQRQLDDDFTLGLQYYLEAMDDRAAYNANLPEGFPAQRAFRDTVTLRLDRMLMYQTLRLSLFAFYSPADNDYFIMPQVTYKFRDDLSATLGVNLFGGDDSATFLGQFDRNDNLYLTIRTDF